MTSVARKVKGEKFTCRTALLVPVPFCPLLLLFPLPTALPSISHLALCCQLHHTSSLPLQAKQLLSSAPLKADHRTQCSLALQSTVPSRLAAVSCSTGCLLSVFPSVAAPPTCSMFGPVDKGDRNNFTFEQRASTCDLTYFSRHSPTLFSSPTYCHPYCDPTPAALSPSSWVRPNQLSFISFRATSVHTFPTHSSAALLLFELLHPQLYHFSDSLRTVLRYYTTHLSNSRPTAVSYSTAEYELTLRQHSFDTLWQHPQHGDSFQHIWSELLQHTAAVEWREWERTVARLYRKLKRRMERVAAEEAEAHRRMPLERAAMERGHTADVEDGGSLSLLYDSTLLGSLLPELKDDQEEQKGWM